jgi:hypothetical protein
MIEESDDSLDYRVLMSPYQAIAVAKAVGEYNAATPERLETFIKGAAKIVGLTLSETRGVGVGIFFAREGSRCLYVKARHLITDAQSDALQALAEECYADEYARVEPAYEPLYRVWWD